MFGLDIFVDYNLFFFISSVSVKIQSPWKMEDGRWKKKDDNCIPNVTSDENRNSHESLHITWLKKHVKHESSPFPLSNTPFSLFTGKYFE